MPAPSDHLRQALHEALVSVGAPAAVADQLASSATVEEHDAVLMLCLNGHRTQLEGHDVVAACEHLAQNAAADNAEAHDRSQRGEHGWTPWWPLPDRRPRHARSGSPSRSGPSYDN